MMMSRGNHYDQLQQQQQQQQHAPPRWARRPQARVGPNRMTGGRNETHHFFALVLALVRQFASSPVRQFASSHEAFGMSWSLSHTRSCRDSSRQPTADPISCNSCFARALARRTRVTFERGSNIALAHYGNCVAFNLDVAEVSLALRPFAQSCAVPFALAIGPPRNILAAPLARALASSDKIYSQTELDPLQSAGRS